MKAQTAPGRGRTVLLVLHGEEIGGASLSALRLREPLAELGWRLEAWAPRPSELFDEVASRGIPVHGEPRPIPGYSVAAMRLPPGARARLARAPRYFASLSRLVRAERPALAHCNSMYTIDEAAWLRAHGLPTVMHIHEMVGTSLKQRAARALIHAVGDVVAGVSTAGIQALGHPRRDVHLIYEGVAAPAQSSPGSKRSDGIRVGTIGVIARRKGTDLFVAAARRVHELDPSIRFEIVGAATDPLEAEWAKGVLTDAASAGIAYAERADVSAKLEEWDAFVLPSRVDPFPIVVLEAMASGLPVIGTRVDGIEEQLADGSGLLVPPEDPSALADQIHSLAKDPGLRSKLGVAARGRVIDLFSLERQAAALSDAYLAALGESTDPLPAP
jgi:glycosyltransferase involved in cell wall biosynthesis